MALRLIRALRGLPWLARSTAACVRRPAAFHPSSPSLWVGIQARQAHVQSHGLTGLLACALLHEHVRPMSSKTLGEAEMSTNAPSELSPMQETTNASPSDLSLMEALTELNSVMNELILKMQASTPEMKEIGLVWVLGLHALATQQLALKQNQETSDPVPPEKVAPLRRYGAFAEAVYDDTVEKFWAFLSTTAQRYVRREDYEMVTFVPVSQRELPAHAVVLDHNKKEIMILIRGTKSVHDILTDVGMETQPFMGAYGHASMVRSVKRLHVELRPVLKEVREANPGYQMTCVGHSLGAGVAVMLAFMLRGDGEPDTKAFVFATPASLSPSLADAASHFTEAVVLGDDMIPRSSVVAFLRLIKQIRHLSLVQTEELQAQTWQQFEATFEQLQQYDWFRASMRSFLESEEVSLSMVLETMDKATNEVGRQLNDQIETLGEKLDEVKKTAEGIHTGLVSSIGEVKKTAEDMHTGLVSSIGDALEKLAPPETVKQQLPLWLVGKEVKEVEADKQEVRAWLDILGSSSANPPSEEKAVSTTVVQALDQRLLLTPGAIYHIDRLARDDSAEDSTPAYAVYLSSPDKFETIIVSPSSLLDHRMGAYNECLEQCMPDVADEAPAPSTCTLS